MRFVNLYLFVILLCIVFNAYSATVPTDATFNISFSFRDNNNALRGKGPASYAICEDGYVETVWIEGTFNP